MNCLACGAAMQTTTGDHLYDRHGLKVLLLQVKKHKCSACEEESVEIPGVLKLHESIARVLVEKPVRLSGDEFRFLRKHMGWSAQDLAASMGVDASTVSRWENNKQDIGATADRLLRLMVATQSPMVEYEAEKLKDIGPARGELSYRFARSDGGWQATAS